MKKIIIILSFLILSGCSTISYVINPQPDISDLYYTEEDVRDKIDELSTGDAKGQIVFDGEHYIMSPEAYKHAVRDGVTNEIQAEKIQEFADDYKRETFFGSLKKDAVDILLGILIMGFFAL